MKIKHLASHIPVLETYVQPGQPVVEFGCGKHSTPILAAMTGRLVCLEHDKRWIDRVKGMVPDSVRFVHVPDCQQRFAELLATEITPEHAVFVDGSPSPWRAEAVGIAQKHLAEVIIAHDFMPDKSHWQKYGYQFLTDNPAYLRFIYYCETTRNRTAVFIRKGARPPEPLEVKGNKLWPLSQE